MNRLSELVEEFKTVFSGRGSQLVDSFLPLLVFLIANTLIGLDYALLGALVMAGGFSLYRITQRASLVYSLGGLGGVLLAALFVKVSGSGAGFFIPGLISGSILVVVCVVSVLLSRPLAAWSSFITRRWPLNWYWHPQVLPAYTEVTIFWALAFSVRLVLEFWLFQQEALGALGAARVFLGWPYTIALLTISYLYGVWRLAKMQGPSIEEFKQGTEPPWEGQKRGF